MTKMMTARTMITADNTLVRTKAGAISVMVLVLCFLASGKVSAAEPTGDSLSVQFHGVLKRKPCHISNDQIINISFGKIGVHKVDGHNYKQVIGYSLICDDPDPSAQVTMTLQGIPTSYNASAIKTSINGLGILILKDGTSMKFGDKTPIKMSSPPLLEAVPVRQPNTALAAGDFQATATLLAEYQ
ncbi:fimbrial protein [Enterobacter bugandensis]|uniref:fimbrial protein n=1 Tax=Enterobacter bugandensis TaxID=881260 RepID=UPI002005C1A8|nr:fimbrial protein [Enterobacter bugandensis]MCK6964553.1 fimbrial protein [Enterobacter bugandensis]